MQHVFRGKGMRNAAPLRSGWCHAGVPALHGLAGFLDAPIGGALHSACGGIGRGRPEIWNRVRRVPQPRRPKTVLRDGRLHG